MKKNEVRKSVKRLGAILNGWPEKVTSEIVNM